MNKNKVFIAIILAIFFLPTCVRSQSGPGGVGSNGNSFLELWMIGDDIGCATASCNVRSWIDRSRAIILRSFELKDHSNGSIFVEGSGLNYHDVVKTSGLNRDCWTWTFELDSFFGHVPSFDIWAQTIVMVARFPKSTKASSGMLGFDGDLGIRGFNQINHPGNANDWTNSGTLRVNGVEQFENVTDLTDWQIITAIRSSNHFGTFYLGGYEEGRYYDQADYAEIIVFGNNQLDKIEQIESYLAIKYGITIDNSGVSSTGDYVDSTGDTIWDAAENLDYNNDIIGIGRDDKSDLLQKQSQSKNDSARIYLGTLAPSNSSNTATKNDFESDRSYCIMGHNAGSLDSDAATDSEIPIQFGGLPVARIEREWKITNSSNSPLSVKIDLKLDQKAIEEDIDVDNLTYFVSSNEDFTSSFPYFSGISIDVGVITIDNFRIQPNSTLYFTVGSVNFKSLPVTLVDFTASVNEENGVDLRWSTATEINNDYFVVELSHNGKDWKAIQKIKGAGTSSELNQYQYVDHRPLPGTSFYRLRQVDFDGTETVFDAKLVKIEGLNEEPKIYPNPAASVVMVEGSNVAGSTVTIMDLSGRIYLQKEIEGISHSVLDLQGLSDGFYVVIISKPGLSIRKKLRIGSR